MGIESANEEIDNLDEYALYYPSITHLVDELEVGLDDSEPAPQPTCALCPNRGHDYSYRFGFSMVGSGRTNWSRYALVWRHLQAQEIHYSNFLRVEEPFAKDPELDGVMHEVDHKVIIEVVLNQGLQLFGE